MTTTVTHYAGEERAAHIRRYDALIEELRAQPVMPVRRTRAR